MKLYTFITYPTYLQCQKTNPILNTQFWASVSLMRRYKRFICIILWLKYGRYVLCPTISILS